MESNANRNYERRNADVNVSRGSEPDLIQPPIDDNDITLPSMSAVTAAEPTIPCASPEPIMSQSDWPTSGEQKSGVSASAATDFADLTVQLGNVSDSFGDIERLANRDTTPAPPPSPDDAA